MKNILYTYLLTVVLSLSASFATAQDIILQNDTLQRSIRQFALDNGMWLEELVAPRYTKVSLQYSGTSGSYRAAQDPQKGRNIRFDSEGALTIKDVRLWGRFSYSNTQEDSTRFGHQTRHNPSAPLYFASYGYNHYERTLYTIQAKGQRYFANRKFSVFAGLDYQIGDHFSNNDPRGSIDEIRVDGHLGGSIRIMQGLDVGTELRYGYGQENVEVAFKNANYTTSPVVSPYLNYIVKGYGWQVTDYLRNMFYQNDARRGGADVYLAWNTAAGKFYANGGYLHERQLFNQALRSEARINDFNHYKLDTWSYRLLWRHEHDNRSYLAELGGKATQGEDFDIESAINNYVYQQEDHRMKLASRIRKQKWDQYYEANALLYAEKRQDGGTGTVLDYQTLRLALSANYTYRFANAQSLEFGLTGLATRGVKNDWQLPEVNENTFHQYVFYHDIVYNGADAWGARVRVAFNFPVRKHTLRMAVEGGMQKASGLPVIDRESLSLPGDQRKDFKIGIELLF